MSLSPAPEKGISRSGVESVARSVRPGPLTTAQIREFEEIGGVTFEGGFSPALIEATSELVGRLDAADKLGGPCDFQMDAEFCELIQAPILELAAKQVLDSNDVAFVSKLAMQTRPRPGTPFGMVGEHTDIHWTIEELESSPRGMLCTFLVWLTDVTMDRGPFMFRPGSHRQIARHLVGRTFPPGKHIMDENIPKLPYAQPVPMLAQKGQISLVTTSTVHSASVVTGPFPRRVVFINFMDRQRVTSDILGEGESYEKTLAMYRELNLLFRTDRRHLLIQTGPETKQPHT